MNTHLIMECVTNRPFERVADDNHQATISMIARLGARARGRAPAPLPARMAMALAPPSKFLSTFLKHRYDVGII
jgi:hypothetical protein